MFPPHPHPILPLSSLVLPKHLDNRDVMPTHTREKNPYQNPSSGGVGAGVVWTFQFIHYTTTTMENFFARLRRDIPM